MHFLGGEREFIKPGNTECSIFDQVDECIEELKKCCAQENIYKLNFFIATSDSDDYHKTQLFISEKVNLTLGNEILVNVIAQAPLTRKVILEVFIFNSKSWQKELIKHSLGKAILFSSADNRFLIGTAQANGNHNRVVQSEKCFFAIQEMLDRTKFSMDNIIRQWNYIQDIIRFDGNNQNYQDFNDVRSKYYGDAFIKKRYPAATGIGMNEGGVIIEFIAMQSDEATCFPIDNPRQTAAHCYSENVLIGNRCDKTTPKFERARFLKFRDRQMMFISGTAAILGEKTIGINNPEEQTQITISNIKRLYSAESLLQNLIKTGNPVFNHCRVYIRHERDFNIIEKTCKDLFDDIPMVFIQANICRDNLLVEIEGEVIL